MDIEMQLSLKWNAIHFNRNVIDYLVIVRKGIHEFWYQGHVIGIYVLVKIEKDRKSDMVIKMIR